MLVLIACFAFGWFALLADEYKQLGKHIAGGAGFISNFLFWNESGYFDNTADTKPLLHLWSLGIEEQFYVVWPLLLWVAYKKKTNCLNIILAIAVVSFALNVYETKTDAVAAFYSPQTRFWELLIGSLLAYATLARQNPPLAVNQKNNGWISRIIHSQAPDTYGHILRNAQSLLGLVLIVVGLIRINKDAHYPGTWVLLPTLGTALIIAAGSQAWLNRKALSNRVLVWFGLISFPLYLWHWPLLSFARIVEIEYPSRNIRIAVVLLSIVLSLLTYKFIEKPMRFGKFGNAKTTTLSVLMIVVGCLGYFIYVQNGLSFRVQKLTEITEAFGAYPHLPFHNENCDHLFPQFKEFRVCKLSKNAEPQILIIGDSHSNMYFNSLAQSLPKNAVMNLAEWSCLPFVSDMQLIGNDCESKISNVLNFVKEQKSLKIIYLTGYWSYLAAGGWKVKSDRWREPIKLEDEQRTSFLKNGESFLSNLTKTNKEIVLMRDVPDLGFNIMSCFDIRPLRFSSNIRKECALEVTDYQKRIAEYDEVLNVIINRFPAIKVYDPKPLFEEENKYWGSKSGFPVYYNGDHLNKFGADIVVNDLLAKTNTDKLLGN